MIGSKSQYCEIHQHLEASEHLNDQNIDNELISGPSPTQQDLNVRTRRAAKTLLENKLIEESTKIQPDWEGCRDMSKIPTVYDVRIILIN